MTIATSPLTRQSRADTGTSWSAPPAAVVQQDPPPHVSAVGSVHRHPTHPPVADVTTALGTPRRPQPRPPTPSVREVPIFAGVGKEVIVGDPPCDRHVAITVGSRGDGDNVAITVGGGRGVKLLCSFGDSKVRLDGRCLRGEFIYNVV